MKQLLSYARRCIEDYSMISPGDRIAVGVSGGKDSLALLATLARLREFYPDPFTLEALTVDMGIPGMDFTPVEEYCASLGIPYTRLPTEINHIIFDLRKEKNPCALCAKMRRGALHDAMAERGLNKIALGHHFDDAVETFFLSLFYEGRLSCFQPVTYLDRTDLTVIRPMLYMTERQVVGFARRQELPIVPSGCPVDKQTKREETKALIRDLEKKYPGLRERVFGAMQRYPLQGWEKTPWERE